MNKKAISPVVATALLLVVAVVAVVSFQTWFNTYQSGLTVKVEGESDTGSSISVERLEGTTTGIIYVKNTAVNNINVTQTRIVQEGTLVCASSGTSFNATANTVVNTSVTGCTMTTGQTYNVVLVTADGVFTESEIAR